MAKILTKDERAKVEYERMLELFRDMPTDRLSLYDGLLRRAAYMRVTLEDYEADLNEKGYVEQFSQSERLAPYERERPVARLYGTMNTNYQKIMKQLMDALPESVKQGALDEIEDFLGTH